MWLSLVERLLWEQDAAGSNPVIRTSASSHNGLLALFYNLKSVMNTCTKIPGISFDCVLVFLCRYERIRANLHSNCRGQFEPEGTEGILCFQAVKTHIDSVI